MRPTSAHDDVAALVVLAFLLGTVSGAALMYAWLGGMGL